MLKFLIWVPGLFLLYPIHIGVEIFAGRKVNDFELFLHAAWSGVQVCVAVNFLRF